MLAIAAKKLGAKRVGAYDYDAVAVRIARENAQPGLDLLRGVIDAKRLVEIGDGDDVRVAEALYEREVAADGLKLAFVVLHLRRQPRRRWGVRYMIWLSVICCVR